MGGPVTVRGVVAGRPRHVVTAEGLAITSFRLLSAVGGRERGGGGCGGGGRRWFVVSALRRLAVNAAGSLSPGDPVLVSGRLASPVSHVGSAAADAAGAALIEAESIGHDLARGRTVFTRGRQADPPDASPAKDR